MYPDDDYSSYSSPLPLIDIGSLFWAAIGLLGGIAIAVFVGGLMKQPPQTAAAATEPHVSYYELQREALLEEAQPVREVRESRGLTYPIIMSLIGGGTMTKIDFVEGNHSNIPSGSNIIVPYQPLKTLIVRNDGPGAIQFSTTQYSGDSFANTPLNKGDSMEIKDSDIFFLNIHAPNQSANVRLVGII